MKTTYKLLLALVAAILISTVFSVITSAYTSAYYPYYYTAPPQTSYTHYEKVSGYNNPYGPDYQKVNTYDKSTTTIYLNGGYETRTTYQKLTRETGMPYNGMYGGYGNNYGGVYSFPYYRSPSTYYSGSFPMYNSYPNYNYGW